MSISACPHCGFEKGGFKVHKCKDCDGKFCSQCENGKYCPYPKCNSTNIWWNYDHIAY